MHFIKIDANLLTNKTSKTIRLLWVIEQQDNKSKTRRFLYTEPLDIDPGEGIYATENLSYFYEFKDTLPKSDSWFDELDQNQFGRLVGTTGIPHDNIERGFLLTRSIIQENKGKLSIIQVDKILK